MLHRHDVIEAARAKINARGVLLAMQAAWGCEGAGQRLDAFFSEMNAIINLDPFAPAETPGRLSRAQSAARRPVSALAVRIKARIAANEASAKRP